MWLKQLRLQNWQTHAELTLDFTNGVNVIYGNSDAGKSCVRRAIAWLFGLESYAEKDIRKEDTKVTSVIGLLDNGIEIERIKSASINRYITRVPGKEEMTYDSIGKVIPQEVQDLILLHNIEIDKDTKLNLNIAKQVDLPFLYNEQWSATSRLKLFDRLTGNDLLDTIGQDFNKEILNISKELKNVKQIIEINTPQVENLTKEISKKDTLRKEIGERLATINKEIVRYTEIKKIQGYLENNRQTLKNTVSELEKIKTIEPGALEALRAKIDTLTTLTKIKVSFLANKAQKDQITSQLAQIKTPDINVEALRVNIKKIEDLKILQNNLKELTVKRQQIINELHLVESALPAQEKEYNDVLKESNICPLCKQDTSKCEAHL